MIGLEILKWVGIVLGGIVGAALAIVLLALILALLFFSVPIRAQMQGHVRQDDTDIRGRISYLLRALQIEFSFDGKNAVSHVKLFGRTVTVPEKEKGKKEKDGADKADPSKSRDVGQDSIEKPSWIERIEERIEQWDDLLTSVVLYDKEGLFAALRRALRHLGRAFHFHRGFLDVTVGLNDPSSTALLLGVFYVFIEIRDNKRFRFSAEPDFLERKIDAEGKFGAHIVLRTMLFAIIGLALNRDARNLFSKITKERKGQKNGSK